VAATLVYDDQLDEEFQTSAMRAGIPLIDTGNAPIGLMEEAVWQNIQDILLAQGIITTTIDLSQLYTNEFVEKAQQ
jgi:hypothetical protein